MADYKQTEITGQQWNRFSEITIENRRKGTPFVRCVEQQVTALQNGEVMREVGCLNFLFNPEEEFAILNPTTNEPTGGVANGAEVYVLIYSYVMAEAAKRDAAQALAAETLGGSPPTPP
jgi:hypothetical protein